jgi:hypothetical protein
MGEVYRAGALNHPHILAIDGKSYAYQLYDVTSTLYLAAQPETHSSS